MVNEMVPKDDFLKTVCSIMPVPVFVTDDDVNVIFANPMSRKILNLGGEDITGRRGGEVLVCLNALEKGCGKSEFCSSCIIRNSVNEAIKGKETLRKKTKMKVLRNGEMEQIYLLVTASPFEYENRKLALLILENINELIQLRGLLSVCANCKKVRNEEGEWEDIVKYIEEHIDVDFSHSYCPECAKKLYGKLADKREK
jgi:hypothetical protein